MNPVRTHYDNLKVARDAPPEVVRAAYKSLSQKYHPDRNPGNSDEAGRIMTIINASYAVLSDPDKRRLHDAWIAESEKPPINETPVVQGAHLSVRQPSAMLGSSMMRNYWAAFQYAQPALGDTAVKWFSQLVRSIWQVIRDLAKLAWNIFLILTAIVLIGRIVSLFDGGTSQPTSQETRPATTAPDKAKYVRPNTAPNGQPWPAYAGYAFGYPQMNLGGLSSVTVDNSKNDSDVFVKLTSLGSSKAFPVRQFYIPAFGKFTLSSVTAGNYDIRYRDLSNGVLSRSESFVLQEIPTDDGTRFSNFSMTLYNVRNGNLQTHGLSEAEF